MRTFLDDRLAYSLNDRKKAILQSKEFIASVDCIIESSSRQSGTYASFRTNLPYAVRGVYAASLKALSMPMNFGTNLYVRTFNVTYGNVGAWPGDFTLPIGYYYYSINQGNVTFAEAQMHLSSNNLLYYILNWFSGALASLSVDPSTGAINWVWDAATGGVTSTDVPAFFNLLTPTTGLAWVSNGSPIDLSGVKQIGIVIPDVSCQNSKSNVVGIPNYFETVPVNVGFGSVLAYEPLREDINWMGASRNLSSINVQVVDTATNTVLPLVSDWSMCVRFYVSQEQIA